MLLLLIPIFPIAFAQAQSSKSRKPIVATRVMSISYGSSAWNTNSQEIDSAFLIMRDENTGKTVQIQLEETEPDSSQFIGQFSVKLGEEEKIAPEIFVPQQELSKSDKDNRKLMQLIQSNQLTRKPIIWKKDARGQSLIDVYDTREQAASALKAYQEQQRLDNEARNKKKKSLTSDAALAATRQMARQKELERLALEAAKRESERVRLEQIERQKADERARQAKELTDKVRAERQAQAKALSEEAMSLFNRGDFLAAEAKFKEALELDPQERKYYYKYGVALYRNEKFNEALVMLNLSVVPGDMKWERGYFIGLTYYRLKELENAVRAFTPVAQSNDPTLGPSAQFYRGVVFYTQEKYELAKTDFETVIDTSSDPRLDEQAEKYIDMIASAMIFQKLREKRFTLMGIVGLMYDSNVLLTPDSSNAGSATDISDFRLMTIGDLEYRAVYTEKHEFSPKLNVSLINSAKNDAAKADPYLTNVSFPYNWKGSLWGKGVRLSARPGHETLFMDPNGTGTKDNILNSYIALMDSLFVMNERWYAGYQLEYRIDDSNSPDSVGVNDSSANKYTLRTTQTLLVDKEKNQAVIGGLAYVLNSAKGDNRKFNRIELSAAYARPAFWQSTWNIGFNIYKQDFPDEDQNRSDFNVTFSTGLSRPWKEWVTLGVNGSYTKNDSSVESNEYTKYTVMTTATFVTNF